MAAGKAKYFSHAASKYHNKSGKNSSTLPVILLVSQHVILWTYLMRFILIDEYIGHPYLLNKASILLNPIYPLYLDPTCSLDHCNINS